jgi:hypothetical protein
LVAENPGAVGNLLITLLDGDFFANCSGMLLTGLLEMTTTGSC